MADAAYAIGSVWCLSAVPRSALRNTNGESVQALFNIKDGMALWRYRN